LVEWKEGIWVAVSAILVSIFILFFNTVVVAIRESAQIEQENTNNVLALRENFKIGRYDNTIVGQEDVINCIMEYRSKVPDVIVDNNITLDSPDAKLNLNINTGFNWNILNTYYLWDGSKSDNDIYPDYRLDNLLEYIPYQATYRARLIKDANSTVIHIWFSRVT
jgi:hypothetical protein